jgi:hypothetical protein
VQQRDEKAKAKARPLTRRCRYEGRMTTQTGEGRLCFSNAIEEKTQYNRQQAPFKHDEIAEYSFNGL